MVARSSAARRARDGLADVRDERRELGVEVAVPAADRRDGERAAAVGPRCELAPDPAIGDERRTMNPTTRRRQPNHTIGVPGSFATLRPVYLVSRSNV